MSTRRIVARGPREFELEDYGITIRGPGAGIVAKRLNEGILEARDYCGIADDPCRGNLGKGRSDMPQLDGKEEEFVLSLSKEGIGVKREKVPAGRLYATQREINTEKVAGILGAIASGKLSLKKIASGLIISKDNYVLDGHHRWATILTRDPRTDMDVIRVDLPIDELLDRAVNWDGTEFAGFEDGVRAASEKKLREDLIRLASKNPSLRSHLLPLLVKKASSLVDRFVNTLQQAGLTVKAEKLDGGKVTLPMSKLKVDAPTGTIYEIGIKNQYPAFYLFSEDSNQFFEIDDYGGDLFDTTPEKALQKEMHGVLSQQLKRIFDTEPVVDTSPAAPNLFILPDYDRDPKLKLIVDPFKASEVLEKIPAREGTTEESYDKIIKTLQEKAEV